jgi:L-fuculose-phosphate aldolase
MRREIASVARRMRDLGLVVATAGNVSARCHSGMLITPTRRHPADLDPDELVELSLDGQAGDPDATPSLEWRLHAAIYRARPDVAAVVHTHSPHATVRSFDHTPLVIQTEERIYFGVDRVEVGAPAAAGSEQLALSTVHALGPRPAALLGRHGVVGVGASPRDALEICCFVEHQALIDSLLARPNALAPEAIAPVRASEG